MRARKFDQKYNVAKIRIERSLWRRKFRIESKLMLNRKQREYFNNYTQWSTSALHLNIVWLSNDVTSSHKVITRASLYKFANHCKVKRDSMYHAFYSYNFIYTNSFRILWHVYEFYFKFFVICSDHALYFHFLLRIFFMSITNILLYNY